MRAIFFILTFSLFGLAGSAQQMSQYSHFVTNYFAFNPAMAGSAPCLDLKLGYRKQWLGLEGSPATAFANLHGNFGQNGNNFHGLGGLVETDDTGPLSFTSIHLAYAYHLKASRKAMFAAGISAGMHQYRVDFGGMTLANPDDPAISGSASNFIYPGINIGLWWYREDRFLGFSIRNVVENRIPQMGSGRMRRHFELMGGKNIELSEDFQFKPAGQIKYVASSRMALDLQAMMDYKDKVALGLGFRSEHGLTGLVKIDMFKYVTLAYAYDFTLNKLRLGGRSTHEVTIGIQACPQGETRYIPCAAYD